MALRVSEIAASLAAKRSSIFDIRQKSSFVMFDAWKKALFPPFPDIPLATKRLLFLFCIHCIATQFIVRPGTLGTKTHDLPTMPQWIADFALFHLEKKSFSLQESSTLRSTTKTTSSAGSTSRPRTSRWRGSRPGTSAGGTAWTQYRWVSRSRLKHQCQGTNLKERKSKELFD